VEKFVDRDVDRQNKVRNITEKKRLAQELVSRNVRKINYLRLCKALSGFMFLVATFINK